MYINNEKPSLKRNIMNNTELSSQNAYDRIYGFFKKYCSHHKMKVPFFTVVVFYTADDMQKMGDPWSNGPVNQEHLKSCKALIVKMLNTKATSSFAFHDDEDQFFAIATDKMIIAVAGFDYRVSSVVTTKMLHDAGALNDHKYESLQEEFQLQALFDIFIEK